LRRCMDSIEAAAARDTRVLTTDEMDAPRHLAARGP
jgi:hypothetical protein